MNQATQNIHLSLADYRLISRLLAGLPVKNESLHRLRRELAHAVVLEPSLIPPTVVGINSRVELEDLDSKETESYTLVAPDRADADQQRISLLAPVGAALIGYREGDEVEWPTPGGLRRLRVLKVTRAG
jgi:regulator of nucleoside diphosphate kinase